MPLVSYWRDSDLTGRALLILAAAVLVIGIGVALLVPLGACPHGGSYVVNGDGHASCMTSDVGYAAASLTPARIGVAVVSVLLTLGLLATFLVRGRRVGGIVLAVALCGGTAGLGVSLARPTYCMGGGDVFSCYYKWLFGWDAAPILADAAWTWIGLLVGGLAGLVVARVTRRA